MKIIVEAENVGGRLSQQDWESFFVSVTTAVNICCDLDFSSVIEWKNGRQKYAWVATTVLEDQLEIALRNIAERWQNPICLTTGYVKRIGD